MQVDLEERVNFRRLHDCRLAREVNNIDELMVPNMAAAMVDSVYHDIAAALKRGARESFRQCAVNQRPSPVGPL